MALAHDGSPAQCQDRSRCDGSVVTGGTHPGCRDRPVDTRCRGSDDRFLLIPAFAVDRTEVVLHHLARPISERLDWTTAVPRHAERLRLDLTDDRHS
jgi:hypothetical protein